MSDTTSHGLLDRLFHLTENKTTVKRECLAGLTTFVSMAYILFVNPQILGDAGMDAGAVFTATALSAILGCLLMGFLANYPISIAPGLGDNAFFTYSVVLAMGMPWQQAMAGVFIASILFTVVSIFRIREIIIDAIPQDLKYAMAAGIGIFISFVGLQGGGIVIADPASIISIGSFKVPTTWLTIFGTLVTALLMARKIPGSIFYGIVITALAGLVTGVIAPPDSIISMAPSLAPTFGVGVTHMGAILTDPIMWAVVVIFFLVAFFDTAGTLIGLAQQAGFMHNGKMPRIGRALMADSLYACRRCHGDDSDGSVCRGFCRHRDGGAHRSYRCRRRDSFRRQHDLLAAPCRRHSECHRSGAHCRRCPYGIGTEGDPLG